MYSTKLINVSIKLANSTNNVDEKNKKRSFKEKNEDQEILGATIQLQY